jgi:hypothetical protein
MAIGCFIHMQADFVLGWVILHICAFKDQGAARGKRKRDKGTWRWPIALLRAASGSWFSRAGEPHMHRSTSKRVTTTPEPV